MNHDAINPANDSPEATNQQASVWMKRGIALLNAGTPDSLTEAVGCFDQAIELRRQLPLAVNPKFRYALAAGWMNRGDALTRLGKNLTEALRSYDEALALLRDLPLDDDPLYWRRLAIAWQNRGLTLKAQGGDAALIEAEKSFAAAIAILQHERAGEILDGKPILATVWMNRANVLVAQKNADTAMAARFAAKQSLALTAPIETSDLGAAQTGFQARYILCQAIAELFAKKARPEITDDELVAEATDTVEDGLALARAWERQGVGQFRAAAADLFRFGARVYQAYQPHFLSEFLLENFDPARAPGDFIGSHEMHAAAMEALWRAFHKIQRQGFKSVNTPEFAAFLDQLRELRVVEEWLAELRRRSVHGD